MLVNLSGGCAWKVPPCAREAGRGGQWEAAAWKALAPLDRH